MTCVSDCTISRKESRVHRNVSSCLKIHETRLRVLVTRGSRRTSDRSFWTFSDFFERKSHVVPARENFSNFLKEMPCVSVRLRIFQFYKELFPLTYLYERPYTDEFFTIITSCLCASEHLSDFQRDSHDRTGVLPRAREPRASMKICVL